MINFPHTSGETTLAVKREYFFKIGGFNSSLASFEDVDLGLRLSKLGKVKLIKNVFTIASLRRFEREGYLKWSLIWLATGLYYIKGIGELQLSKEDLLSFKEKVLLMNIDKLEFANDVDTNLLLEKIEKIVNVKELILPKTIPKSAILPKSTYIGKIVIKE
jgi:GT2 family glycosyltransferase